MRLLWLASVVVLASACFQAPEEALADGGAGGGAGGGVGGGAMGGGVGGGPTGGGTGTLLFGAVRPDCAPDDGPAFSFVLTEAPVGCEIFASYSERFQVSLWTGALERNKAYSLGTTFAHDGAACLCGVVSDQATSGFVTLVDVTDAGVTGRVDAVFESGAQRHDRFEVVMCPGLPFCG